MAGHTRFWALQRWKVCLRASMVFAIDDGKKKHKVNWVQLVAGDVAENQSNKLLEEREKGNCVRNEKGIPFSLCRCFWRRDLT